MPKTDFSFYTLSQILPIFTSKTYLAWTKMVKETLKLKLHVQTRRLNFGKEMYIMTSGNEGPVLCLVTTTTSEVCLAFAKGFEF